jgi:hypothetical protein
MRQPLALRWPHAIPAHPGPEVLARPATLPARSADHARHRLRVRHQASFFDANRQSGACGSRMSQPQHRHIQTISISGFGI